MYRNAVCGLVLASLSSLSFAEPLKQVNNDFHRIFLSVEYAQNEHDISIGGDAGDFFDDVTESSASHGIKAGYWLGENVAIAVGYVDFGSPTISDLDYSDSAGSLTNHKVEADAFTASAIISSAPFVNPWRFYGELGLFQWDYKWTSDLNITNLGSGTPVIVDDNGVGIWGGLGVGFDIIDQLEVKFALEWYIMDVDFEEFGEAFYLEDDASIQINRYALSLNYQF